MAMKLVILTAGLVLTGLLEASNSCDQVPGGPGNGKKSHIASFACRCSGAGGCDSVSFKDFSNANYAEMVISDASGRRFEQQPTDSFKRT